ncbi:MAG: hypothetical protein AAFR61_30135, partial [Bacteroidota bacterium]
HPNRALIAIRNELRDRLHETMIHIKNEPYYETINEIRQIHDKDLAQEMGLDPETLIGQFKAQKKIIADLEQAAREESPEMPLLQEVTTAYTERLKLLKMRDHVIRKGNYSLALLLLQGLGLLITAPLFLFGFVNNYHIYRLVAHLAISNFKDDHFHTSMMLVLGLTLYPIFYLVQGLIVGLVTGSFSIAVLYVFATFATGYFAMQFSMSAKKWWARWRFFWKKRQQNPQVMEAIAWRKSLVEKLKSLMGKAAEEAVA